MHREAKGVLAIWHDIAPEHWDETLDWYDREHHAERVDIPGFLSVRRMLAVDAVPRLFIRYETTDVEVLASDAYLARLNNPTPWSLARQPTIINNTRTVCRIAHRAGRAEGGFALTLRFSRPAAGQEAAGLDWAGVSARLLGRWGVLGAEVWTADLERSTIPTQEKRLRATPDRVVERVLVVHASEETPLRQALEDELAGHAAESGLYRLSFMLR